MSNTMNDYSKILFVAIVCLFFFGTTPLQAQSLDGSLIFRSERQDTGWEITFDPNDITYLSPEKNTELTTRLRAVPRSTLQSLSVKERENLVPNLRKIKREFYNKYDPMVIMSDGRIVNSIDLTGRYFLGELVFWGTGPYALKATLRADTKNVTPEFLILSKKKSIHPRFIADTNRYDSTIRNYLDKRSVSIDKLRFYGKNANEKLWSVKEKGCSELYFVTETDTTFNNSRIPNRLLRGPSTGECSMGSGIDTDQDSVAEIIMVNRGKPFLFFLDNNEIKLLDVITPH